MNMNMNSTEMFGAVMIVQVVLGVFSVILFDPLVGFALIISAGVMWLIAGES